MASSHCSFDVADLHFHSVQMSECLHNRISLANVFPVENDGGPGTANGHSEEGYWTTTISGVVTYIISTNDRTANGIFHPALGSELMTGVSTGSNELSKITIGYLGDLGYLVDYNQADNYVLAIN